jgi:molybdopterin-binding protein
MPETESVRIEIGFVGGQMMSSMVTASSADELEAALAKPGEPILTLKSNEGPFSVVLAHVVYVKRFPPEGRIGFIAT